MSSTDLLTSPTGEIQFMALANPVSKKIGDDANKVYGVRLKFDASTEEGKAWKEAITSINSSLIGTTHVNSKNEFTVRAFSKFQPKVTDAKGNEIEEMPYFFNDSKGTAKLIVQPYTKNKLGGTINLVAVVICSLESGQKTEGREERLAALKNALQEATK